MKRLAIEIQITALVIIIVAAIFATGYLSYKNLSQIVSSIYKETRPDYKLIKVKEITASLAEVESSVRLYSLTHEPKYLRPYNDIITTVDKKIENLIDLQGNDTTQIITINAVSRLIEEKLIIWDQILQLHSHPIEKEVFSDFYKTLEKKTSDTSIVKKSSVLRRFFKRKEEIQIAKKQEEIQETEMQLEVVKLEETLKQKKDEKDDLERQLLQKNWELSTKLQFYVLQLEQRETESLLLKSIEADLLAKQTYKWLAFFCIAAVIMLLSALYIIFNYSRKTKASQQALKLANIQAENLVKAKELFTANVSHELRSPMNAIHGMTEQLLQHPMDNQLKEQLTIIKNAAGYMKNVVNDILDFSKIQAGKLTLEAIPFNPTNLIEEICSLNKTIANQKNLNLTCSIDKNTPTLLLGDPTRLRQILLNLLSNAIKFTEQGEVSVKVESIARTNDEIVLKISVSDTGIGIAPDKLKIVFDDYTQADNSTNRKYGGTGLGLSIVKSLAELLGGSIVVSSLPGNGTTFTCTLPYKISHQKPSGSIEDLETPFIPDELRSISVLIADDEEYNRFLLITILTKWGIKHEVATNGIEAVELAKTTVFDLILMDIRMPKKSGVDAASEIRSFSPATKIIAITADNLAHDAEKYKKTGIIRFLVKPFSERELLEIILSEFKIISGNASTGSGSEMANETIPPIDMNNLRLMANNDEIFIQEMLEIFVRSTREGLQEINLYIRSNDLKMVADTAHKMASPCRHMGAIKLLSHLKEIETLARKNENSSAILEKNRLIELEASTIIAFIERQLKPTSL